jgi:hypothetical protein
MYTRVSDRRDNFFHGHVDIMVATRGINLHVQPLIRL